MLLDGPRDRHVIVHTRRRGSAADFAPPESRKDWAFFPIAALLAFPIAFAVVRLLENAVVARRHEKLAPETDIARRVSIVVDSMTRKKLEARIRQCEVGGGAEGGRSAQESHFVRIVRTLEGVGEVATYASLETSMDTPSNAAQLVARWHEELTETFASESMEMTSPLDSGDPDPDLPTDGFAVLSVLLHAGGSLPFPPARIERATFPLLIDSLIGERGFLETYQLVWSPAEENEVLTAESLASSHPDLVPLDPALTSDQKMCRFCTARFSIEMTACPTCGAPEEISDARHSLDEVIHVEDVACRQCKTMFPSHRYRCPSCGAHRFTESGKPPPVERASVPPPPGAERKSVPPGAQRKSVPPPNE